MLQERKSNLAQRRVMMSSYEDAPPHGAAPSAARTGADLRAARERLGWTLPAIAAHLRIRLPYLEALEEGRTGDLPGVAYALGFLRTYAQALGLDPDEMARRFRNEAAEANRKTELNFPAPVPERGVPAGAVVLVGAVLAIAAYAGWYRMSETPGPSVEQVQPVPERLAPLAEKVAPPPPAPAAEPAPDAATGEPSALAAAPPPAPSLPASSPTAAAAATLPASPAALPPVSVTAPVVPSTPAPAPAPAPAAAPPASPVQAAVAEPAAPKPGGPRLVLRAKADAWMQVRDKSGAVLLNRVLRSGEAWPVPDRPSLLLTTGNAGGTELLVDGEATPSLGNDGAVRRDLPLDAEAIKAGRLAPVPPKRS